MGHDFAILSWSPPADDGGGQIRGYVVEKKVAGRRLFQRCGQVSAHTNQLLIDELEMDTEYLFRVAATNTFGVGEFSRECEIETGIPYTAPRMHSAPKVTDVLDSSCRIEWSDCAETGGSPLFAYEVFGRCLSEGEKESIWRKLNDPDDEYTFSNHFWVSTEIIIHNNILASCCV